MRFCSEYNESAALSCDSSVDMRKLKNKRGAWHIDLRIRFANSGQIARFPIFLVVVCRRMSFNVALPLLRSNLRVRKSVQLIVQAIWFEDVDPGIFVMPGFPHREVQSHQSTIRPVEHGPDSTLEAGHFGPNTQRAHPTPPTMRLSTLLDDALIKSTITEPDNTCGL